MVPMSFKIHLIIVSAIIVVVYAAWQMMASAPPQVVQQGAPASAYSIIVAHASWGLNCHYRTATQSVDEAYGTGAKNKLREDNALVAVSAWCNGKPLCEIPLTPEALGEDPAPECSSKELHVEYRCFSYDRAWDARATSGKLVINCEKSGGGR